MILGRGYGFLESAGGGVMEYPQRKKEGYRKSMNTLFIPRNMIIVLASL